jgi:hypothetical protein
VLLSAVPVLLLLLVDVVIVVADDVFPDVEADAVGAEAEVDVSVNDLLCLLCGDTRCGDPTGVASSSVSSSNAAAPTLLGIGGLAVWYACMDDAG